MRDHVGAAEVHFLVEGAQLVLLALGRLRALVIGLYYAGESERGGRLLEEGCSCWGRSRVYGCEL